MLVMLSKYFKPSSEIRSSTDDLWLRRLEKCGVTLNEGACICRRTKASLTASKQGLAGWVGHALTQRTHVISPITQPEQKQADRLNGEDCSCQGMHAHGLFKVVERRACILTAIEFYVSSRQVYQEAQSSANPHLLPFNFQGAGSAGRRAGPRPVLAPWVRFRSLTGILETQYQILDSTSGSPLP